MKVYKGISCNHHAEIEMIRTPAVIVYLLPIQKFLELREMNRFLFPKI
jgi:hypothetical protein